MMIVCIIVREFLPAISQPLLLLAIVCGWGAAALVAHRIGRLQRVLVGGMILVGVIAMALVQHRTGTGPWLTAVTQSLPLVTMILSVGFLKRIALKAFAADAQLPTGFSAYRDTILMVSVFGAFINISASILVADRISRREPLTQLNASAITRAFSTCVNWSPFFAGMAVVISYAPTFSVPAVILQGIPLAILGVVLALAAGWKNKAQLSELRGFPAKWSSLWIPTVLGVVVVTLRYLFDSAGLLPVIALSALSVVVVYLCVVESPLQMVRSFHTHISEDLPQSFNELTLLLSVGVLAAGLVAWVGLGEFDWQPPLFTGWTAIAVLGLMIVIAMAGIHPVVTIALAASLLIPVDPNPELLATTFLLGWSLGTLACPLSGTHLIMQGRYAVSSWQSAIRQWPYVFVMFVLGSVWLKMLAAWYNV